MAQGRASIKHRVKLTAEERDTLKQLLRRGRVAGWKNERAQALLQCDESEKGLHWSDVKIAEGLGITTRTIEKWRKQAVENGPLSLLERKSPDRSRQRILDGEGEAKLIQLACSTPPEGRDSWTLQLLADEIVTLGVADSISYECVRRTLKKMT